MALSAAVTEGRLKALLALRDMLAADLDLCESMRDKAALSQRFMDVLEQIESVEKAQPAPAGTALDEFTRRRSERQTSSPPRPAKRQQRG